MKIAISGKQRSGKTALANAIEKMINDNEFPIFAYRVSLANELKRIAQEEFGIVKDSEIGREVLQKLAHVGRTIDENFWVNKLIDSIKRFEDMTTINQIKDVRERIFIVDDLRYKNEAEKLKSEGFFLIRIECDDEIRKHRNGEELKGEDHISETNLDDYYDFDLYVFNDGRYSLDDLAVDVLNHIEALMDE